MARKLWCVTEPKPTSTLGDCLFECTTVDFVLQVRGGLSDTDKPELHPTKAEALADLTARCARIAGNMESLAEAVAEAEAGLTFEHQRPDGRVVRVTVPK